MLVGSIVLPFFLVTWAWITKLTASLKILEELLIKGVDSSLLHRMEVYNLWLSTNVLDTALVWLVRVGDSGLLVGTPVDVYSPLGHHA